MTIKISSLQILMFVSLIILYAGISSKLVGPFKVSEAILILFTFVMLCINKYSISKKSIKYFAILILIIVYGTFIGLINNNPFVASDINVYSLLIASIAASFIIPKYLTYDTINKIFYSSVFLVLAIYIIINQTSLFTNYYFLESAFENLSEEELQRVFGPAAQVLLVYFYIMIVLTRKKSILLEMTFLFFTFIIYSFSGSREVFVTMFSVFILNNLYKNKKYKLYVVILIIISFSAVMSLVYINERFSMIFDPFSTTQFKYRLLTDGLFLEHYFNSDLKTILFGYGFGAQLSLYLGSHLSEIKFTLLDNGPLTIMMKSGLFGLLMYLYIILNILKKLRVKEKVILLTPFIISSMLSSHILIKFIFILGLYTSANYIKYKRGLLSK